LPYDCFIFFSLFDFEYALNLKNKPCFLVPDGMLVVNAQFEIKTCVMKQSIGVKNW
jgi:hypothetical protein